MWLDQQMREKQAKRKQEKENEANYADYVAKVTQVRGELARQFAEKKTQNQVDMMKFNQKMATKKQIQKENEKREKFLEERDYLNFQEEIRKETDYVPSN